MQPNAYPPRQYSCLACGAARSSRVCGTCLKNGQSLTGLLGFWQERERLRRKLLDARRLDHIIKAQEERQARKRRLRHRRETLEHELQTARDHVKRRRDAAGKNLALAGREVSRLLRWGADHQRYHTLDAKRHTCCFAVASTEQLRVAALLLRDVCIIFRPTVAARKDWAMPAVTSVQGWRIPALDGLQAVSDAHGLSAALGFVGHLLQALQLILGPPCTSCVLYRGCQSSIVRTAQFADLFCLPFASDSRGHAAQQWANFENQPGDGLGAPATSEVMQAGRPRNMPLYISGAENISETLSGANPSRDEWRHHELRAALGCLHRAVLVTSASQAHLCGTLYLPPTRPPTEILLRLLHKLCMNGRSTSCDAYAAGTRSNVHPVAPAGPPKNALPGSPSSPVLHHPPSHRFGTAFSTEASAWGPGLPSEIACSDPKLRLDGLDVWAMSSQAYRKCRAGGSSALVTACQWREAEAWDEDVEFDGVVLVPKHVLPPQPMQEDDLDHWALAMAGDDQRSGGTLEGHDDDQPPGVSHTSPWMPDRHRTTAQRFFRDTVQRVTDVFKPW